MFRLLSEFDHTMSTTFITLHLAPKRAKAGEKTS